jgi:signal peptidase I
MWSLAVVPLIAASLAVWWLRRSLAVVTVSGISMRPTFQPGDRVLARRVRPRALRRGQVVVVEAPPYDGRQVWWRAGLGSRKWLIKRVSAIPGDVPDGVPVPAGHLFVLGDNPAASGDSRLLGHLPVDRVLGVVVRRL